MGNCLSIKVDKERRVWVRKRRQRSTKNREGMKFPSHGTAYQDTLPNPASKRERRRGEALDHLQLPFSYAVPHANYILPPPWVGASSSTMPEPSMPTQQMPTQQVPAQQMPAQEASVQYPTGPQSQPQQPWAQQPTQQSTMGMNPGLARAMMQDS